MPRIPIFRLGGTPEQPALPKLLSSSPFISLKGLAVGVDNLRHDVVLSPRFAEAARAQIARLIARHGELEGLLAAEAPARDQGPSWMRNRAGAPRVKSEPAEWKSVLAELHVATLNRAKKEHKLAVDILARLAVMKFLRVEMSAQFAQVLERCRVLLKSYDSTRQQRALEYRERVATFQVKKKIILRKTGQELFQTLREVDKETLARTRRSLFGEETDDGSYFTLSAVSEPAGAFRGWPRRLSVCRVLRDAGELGSRCGPLWPDAGDRVGISARVVRGGNERGDDRWVDECSGEFAGAGGERHSGSVG